MLVQAEPPEVARLCIVRWDALFCGSASGSVSDTVSASSYALALHDIVPQQRGDVLCVLHAVARMVAVRVEGAVRFKVGARLLAGLCQHAGVVWIERLLAGAQRIDGGRED